MDLNLPDIPIGRPVENLVEWMRGPFTPFFDAVYAAIRFLLDVINSVLTGVPDWAVILLLTVLAWAVRRWGFAIFTLLSFGLIDLMGLWREAMSTLTLVMAATLIAIAIGVPIGIWASRSLGVSRAVRPVLDLMQTMPAFVYLIPAVFFFRIGEVPGVVATVIFAMPPAIRLTELGIRQVGKEVVEAASAFGATSSQLLTKVQLPLALPTIMAGVNQVIMLALSMVVIAGMIGAGGLGASVVRALTQLNLSLGFEAGLGVVILAVFLDRLTEGLAIRSSRATSRGAAT